MLCKPTLKALIQITTDQNASDLMHNPYCLIPDGAFDDFDTLGEMFEEAHIRSSALWPFINHNPAACDEYLFYTALVQFTEAKIFLLAQTAPAHERVNQAT